MSDPFNELRDVVLVEVMETATVALGDAIRLMEARIEWQGPQSACRGRTGVRSSARYCFLSRDTKIPEVPMGLDPAIAAAIITAAGGLASKLLEKLLGLAGQSPPDERTSNVLAKVYDRVADAVSPNSLRTMLVLHDARSFLLAEQILEAAQELANRQESGGKPFERDITYRLRYLCLLGLLRAGTSDFALTALGAAFIEKARGDHYRYGRAFTMGSSRT